MASPDDLLTTGQAAELLGSSRQHVVDLCRSGRLPFQVIGTHRRVRRADVMNLLRGSTGATREELRSRWLHHAIAGKLALDPEPVLAKAKRNLTRIRAEHSRGPVGADLDRWTELISGPLPVLLEMLVALTAEATELRQNSPFAGVLSERERTQALDAFRAASRVA